MQAVGASVLVPVLNEEAHIRDTVHAMRRQRFDGRLEFLLIDGRSTDRTLAILRELQAEDPRIRVLDNPAGATPQALNLGLCSAQGTYIVRMDAHTLYPPDYIARGVERLQAGDVAWVAGFQVPHADGDGAGARRTALALGTRLGTGASRRWLPRAATAQSLPAGDEIELDTGVFGGVWRRSTLLEAGGWDEGFAQNQDAEQAARILERGGRIVCLPEMSARYLPRGTLRGLARQYFNYGYYRAKNARLHPRSLRRSHLLLPAVPLAATAAVAGPRVVRGPGRAAMGIYIAALAATAAGLARRDTSRRDAAAVPAVLATMHTAFGLGFLRGFARYAAAAPRPATLAHRTRPGRPRIAVYTDYVYRRDGDDLYADRAFALFMAEVGAPLDGLVLLGRLDPRPGPGHYRLPDGVEVVGLPYYPSLARPVEAVPALVRALRRCWRSLDDVDGAWLFGPYLLSLAIAGMCVLRGRRVALGVRQDLPCYIRSRHPGRPVLHRIADGLEVAYRVLARRRPTVVVGADLARRYAHASSLLRIDVSMVRERELRGTATGSRPPDDGALRVLSVGRLEREKNPLLLADILADLRRDGRPWRLVVCGEGPLAHDLERRLHERGVRQHADLLGYVPIDGGLRELYASSHVFLHVSRTEGMPQVLLEAFAARVPVVATDVGGVAEVAEGRAMLVAPDDAAGAAAAVRAVACDAELRRRLVAAGLDYVRDRTFEGEARRVADFLTAAFARG
jgi:glycosyltransferase involved in cell wall biosynthesis